jgi:hypothetical protein
MRIQVTFVRRSCPYCDCTLDTTSATYFDLGSPLQVCPQCGRAVRVDHINEWELIPAADKVWLFLRKLFWPVLLGVLVGFVTYVAGVHCFQPDFRYNEGFHDCSGNVKWLSTGAGAAVAVVVTVLSWWRLVGRINESRRRMANPTYRRGLGMSGVKLPPPRSRLSLPASA